MLKVGGKQFLFWALHKVYGELIIRKHWEEDAWVCQVDLVSLLSSDVSYVKVFAVGTRTLN